MIRIPNTAAAYDTARKVFTRLDRPSYGPPDGGAPSAGKLFRQLHPARGGKLVH
jgi:hypothetical protein